MSELVEKWKETGLLHELEDKEEKLLKSGILYTKLLIRPARLS